VAGADSATFSVEATQARNGVRYRCVVTGSDGTTKTTNTVTLTVT
jgi:hypothetical protein